MNRWMAVGLLVLMGLWGCTTDPESDSGKVLYPDSELNFWIYPNDGANNDSVSANLAHGIILEVHPHATYNLSFDADTAAGAPTLQLFRIYPSKTGTGYKVYQVRVIDAKLENGRYSYEFTCEEGNAAEWVTTLEKKGTYYTGKTNNVRFTGNGAFSDHMSLNLVVAGDVRLDSQMVSVETLGQEILAGFRKFYTSIVIDTLYISYANDHPVYGSLYPASQPWIAGRSDNDIMMQKLGGKWTGLNNALDLVLVLYIDEVGLLGYSYLFSGNMGDGEGSTVVLGTHVKGPTGIMPVGIQEIVETAVHESGHFLGLRHTTSTKADQFATGDYSVLEDGLTDTPFCEDLLNGGFFKKSPSSTADFKIRYGSRRMGKTLMGKVHSIMECPDATNLMFPAETEMEYEALSPQQLDLVRKTLMIYPH